MMNLSRFAVTFRPFTVKFDGYLYKKKKNAIFFIKKRKPGFKDEQDFSFLCFPFLLKQGISYLSFL